MQSAKSSNGQDDGAILILVLVVTVVMALVIFALADYTVSALRYGQASERRADRFAAAQAAMDNALERMEIKRSLCSTGVPEEIVAFPELVNDTAAEVRCTSIGGTSGDTEGWALVLTGVGAPDHQLVVQSGGGATKYIGGRVWMEDPTSLDVKVDTVIEGGDLWYPGGCTPPERTALGGTLSPRLSFDGGYGTMCSTGSWTSIFRPPATSVPASLSPTNGVAVAEDSEGCTVFEPGLYTSQPILGASNYFKSGNYYFRNVGPIQLKDERVLFGNVAGVEGFPSIENPACDYARGLDNTSGATVYIGGNTRFVIEAAGALEFSFRTQIGGSKRDRVSLHVIDPGLGAQPSWSDPLISTQPGNNKEFAAQGLVWAPNAGLQFGEVTNDTTAALRGGAVLSKLDAGASASASAFLIETTTASTSRMLQLTSTATNEGVLSIRVVLDWRPSNGDTALKTWRVCQPSGC
jgi:hypothetical protein